jgi:hypothetical protein
MLLEDPRSEASPDAERSLDARSHVGVLAPHDFSNSSSRDKETHWRAQGRRIEIGYQDQVREAGTW